jgi:hypothetical protein
MLHNLTTKQQHHAGNHYFDVITTFNHILGCPYDDKHRMHTRRSLGPMRRAAVYRMHDLCCGDDVYVCK